jgi:UrcA family protein
MNLIDNKSLLATILCLALTGPAFAGVKSSASDNPSVESVTVSYIDLDINRAEGLAILNKRLEKAAKSVCHVNDFSFSRMVKASRQECFEETLSRASEQIGNSNAITMISR